MKTELTIEESDELIKFGVDPRAASETENKSPKFTLADLMKLLPRFISIHDNDTEESCPLIIKATNNPGWSAYYYASIPFHSKGYQHGTEFIDALRKLLIWVIKHSHSNSKSEKGNETNA